MKNCIFCRFPIGRSGRILCKTGKICSFWRQSKSDCIHKLKKVHKYNNVTKHIFLNCSVSPSPSPLRQRPHTYYNAQNHARLTFKHRKFPTEMSCFDSHRTVLPIQSPVLHVPAISSQQLFARGPFPKSAL